MKILLIITGLAMGGAEHVVSNLADRLTERGHQVTIAYLTGPIIVKPENKDIEIIPLELNNTKDFLKSYIKLRSLIKKIKPDVVHSHMFHSNIISRLIRLTTHIPKLVCSAHNTNEGGKLRMIAYRYTDKLADISTNVSQEAVESFIAKGAFPANRSVHVVNGIDTEKFYFNSLLRDQLRQSLNLTTDVKMILAVGRLHNQKDYPTLLKAIKLLTNERKDFKLFIAGDGPLREELILLTENLHIQNFVKFIGIHRDIPSLMSASDVFVLSSAWEGFGLVVAEAMACERVVVATDCGGVKEVIGDNNNGLLVPIKDSKSLANKLSFALSLNKQDKDIFGKNARQHIIDNFSLDANVEAYLNLYNL